VIVSSFPSLIAAEKTRKASLARFERVILPSSEPAYTLGHYL
jgi:hypothetical protein